MNLRRMLAFARHVPPRQIARRIFLSLKRRALDRGRPPLLRTWKGSSPVAIRTFGLHAPHGRVWFEQGRWRACFLNDERELGADIAWAQTSGNAHDQLWRMNLHYFEYLPEVPDAFLVTLIDGWISQCRPKSRVASSAAWTPYAISLRIGAWLEAWSTRGPFGNKAFVAKFASSLAEQATYLAANLETDVCGNHLIKNVRALSEVAATFGIDGLVWRARADRHLKRELKRQILSDGVHYERTPSYHNQVLADLLMVSANRGRDDAIAKALEAALRKMVQASADLTHPDGAPAQFGDSGLSMTVSTAACSDAFSSLYDPAPAPRPTFSYPEGGFHGARSGGDYFVVRMGKLGADALMAHAHGDWGSFEWSVDGQRVIVDQGVTEYSQGAERRISRSTHFHNTAVLDDAEQADFFGAFRCGVRPNADDASILATPRGFAIIGDLNPAMHRRKGRQRRQLEIEPGVILITDDALTGEKLNAQLLLHPTVVVSCDGRSALLSWSDDLRVIMTVEGGEFDIQPAEWWPDMGRAEKTSRIVMRGGSRVTLSMKCTELRTVERSQGKSQLATRN